MRKLIAGAALALIVTGAGSTAFAGEVGGNGEPTPIRRHVASSICAFNGLDDGSEGGAVGPGYVQSFGSIVAGERQGRLGRRVRPHHPRTRGRGPTAAATWSSAPRADPQPLPPGERQKPPFGAASSRVGLGGFEPPLPCPEASALAKLSPNPVRRAHLLDAEAADLQDMDRVTAGPHPAHLTPSAVLEDGVVDLSIAHRSPPSPSTPLTSPGGTQPAAVICSRATPEERTRLLNLTLGHERPLSLSCVLH